MPELRLSLLSHLILLLILDGRIRTLGTITPDPQLVCFGEQVTVDCTLTVPGVNDNFLSVVTNYIVGNSDTPLTAIFVNGTAMSGGVDLSKLIAFRIIGNTSTVQGIIVLLSYTPEDNDTRLGCTNEYQISGGGTDTLVETINVIQAAPPTAVTLLVSLSSLSPATCSGTVSVAWTLEASDRD